MNVINTILVNILIISLIDFLKKSDYNKELQISFD